MINKLESLDNLRLQNYDHRNFCEVYRYSLAQFQIIGEYPILIELARTFKEQHLKLPTRKALTKELGLPSKIIDDIILISHTPVTPRTTTARNLAIKIIHCEYKKKR